MTKKPGRDEDEYFQKLEQAKLSKLVAQRSDKLSEAELDKLRELHWNHCARCGHVMETEAFRGQEIERCPNCGGVFLDKGELEALAGKDRSGFLAGIAEAMGMGGTPEE